jgi:ProP effector
MMTDITNNNPKPSRPILKLNSFKKDIAETAVEKVKATLALKIPKPPSSLPKIDKQVAIAKTSPVAPSGKEPKQVPKKDTKQELKKEPKEELKQEPQEAQKAKPKHFIAHKDFSLILKYFREHFPKCFLATKVPLPLAVGIHYQILAIPDLPFSKTLIRKFLCKYTKSAKYRKALILGNDRINLDGSAASKILEEEVPKWQYDKKANQQPKPEKAQENKEQQI